ncbi:MAG: hypothetical protein V1706_08540 [Pseudomonadota bacterium]
MAQKQTVSVEDALKMEMLINQALIDLLIEKGIFTQKELLKKIADLRREVE